MLSVNSIHDQHRRTQRSDFFKVLTLKVLNLRISKLSKFGSQRSNSFLIAGVAHMRREQRSSGQRTGQHRVSQFELIYESLYSPQNAKQTALCNILKRF